MPCRGCGIRRLVTRRSGRVCPVSGAKASIPDLPGWPEYCRIMKESSDGAFIAGAPTRFHSRCRLAKSFRALDLDGYGDARTSKGNDVLFRLMLSFSAIDQLGAIDRGIRGRLRSIDHRPTADALRAELNIDAIVTNEKVCKMRARGEFDDIARTPDLMVFAAALRNIIAHVSATPWGLGVMTDAAYQAVDQLSARLLVRGERESLELVEGMR